jgi:sarcosine oxidase subunit gamma
MNGPFVLRHALDGAVSANPARGPNHVEILPDPLAVSVSAQPGRRQAAADALSAFGDAHARFTGPGEWLVVGERHDGAQVKAMAEALGADALVTDQSAARVVLRLSGPAARAILAKLTPLDLHADVFAEGQSGNALFAHVGANIARLDGDRFEIVLMRSFAVFAFQELMEMGLEFGLTAGFAT